VSRTEDIISWTEQNGIVVVKFIAKEVFDIESAEELAGQLRQLAQAKGGRQWVIDFTGVELIITPVVSGLLSALRSDRESGGDIALCGMGETVSRVIELARLDRVFYTFDTLAEALAAVGAKQSS